MWPKWQNICNMKIFLASDHAGWQLKQTIAAMLREQGHDIADLGDKEPQPEDDYPDFMFPAAQAVVSHPDSRAILFGGSGQGEAMAANRVKSARAAVYYGGQLEIVRLSREHNDANVLSLGARFLSEDEAKEAVTVWLATPFSGDERHARRIKQLDQ
jgi:ribose 5-phosphate isomerase B